MDTRGVELNLPRPKSARHPANIASLLFPAGFETGTIRPFPDGATSGQAAGKTVPKLGLAPGAVDIKPMLSLLHQATSRFLVSWNKLNTKHISW